MKNVNVMNHPLIQHKMTILRDKNTGTKDFRTVVNEISRLLAYEVSYEMTLENIEINTPIAETTQNILSGKKIVIVPILRAGLGMVDGILDLIPTARVGHIGMYRDEETLEPIEYFLKLPREITQRQTWVVEPMIATGGSSIAAVDALKEYGAKDIKFISLIGAQEGVKALAKAHDDINIYIAAIDEKLNDSSYIEPGLGDAGDRLFGTR